MYDSSYADVILNAWERTAEVDAEDVAHWDVVAATNSPTDMATFMTRIHGQGRQDLSAPTLNERRDAFLHSALERLS